MNGSVQRTIPNVMLPFRSKIPKSRSAAYYGSEYQLPHYAATDISRRELAAPPGIRASIPHTQTLEDERKPSPKMRPGFPLPAPIKNGAKYQLQHYVATDIFCCVSVVPEARLEHAKRG